MTPETAYQTVVDAIKAISATQAERRGRFTHDAGDPAQADLLERAFRLDVLSYDPPGPEGVTGCSNRHMRLLLKVAYQYTDDAQLRALADANDIIAAIRSCDGGAITITLESSEFNAEETLGWLFHERTFNLEHRGT